MEKPFRHSIYTTLLAIVVLLKPCSIYAANSIVKGPAMMLEGQSTFSMDENVAGGDVTWTVDREVRPEEEEVGQWTRTNNVDSGFGQMVTFYLPKVLSKETVYFVHATGTGFNDTRKVQVFPQNQRSSFIFESTSNPDILTYITVPSTLSPATHLLAVMHGAKRNGNDYCNSWVTWASQNDYIVMCPTFSQSDWPNSAGYNLGNVFSGSNCSGSLVSEDQWAFTSVDDIQNAIRNNFALTDESFDMWGHSAGGQFTHRFMLFKPNANVRIGMPANSGWYTLPDTNIDCPYGVNDPQLIITIQDLMDWTNNKMVIMRGVLDTQRDSNLRQTEEADAQGLNRYERAGYMFDKGRQVNPGSSWQLIDVVGVGHEQRDMATAAQGFLRQNPPPEIQSPLNDDVSSGGGSLGLVWLMLLGITTLMRAGERTCRSCI